MGQAKDDTLQFESRAPIWAKALFGLGLPSVILEVKVSKSGISIKTLYGNNKYGWEDITDVFTIAQIGYTHSTRVTERYLVLRTTDNKKYRLGTMAFQNGKVLIDEAIPKYIKVAKHAYKEMKWLFYFALLVWVGLLLVFVRTNNWGYVLADVISIFLYQFLLLKINKM